MAIYRAHHCLIRISIAQLPFQSQLDHDPSQGPPHRSSGLVDGIGVSLSPHVMRTWESEMSQNYYTGAVQKHREYIAISEDGEMVNPEIYKVKKLVKKVRLRGVTWIREMVSGLGLPYCDSV